MCDVQVVVQCTILYCACIFQRRYLIVTDALIRGVFPVCAMYKYTSGDPTVDTVIICG